MYLYLHIPTVITMSKQVFVRLWHRLSFSLTQVLYKNLLRCWIYWDDVTMDGRLVVFPCVQMYVMHLYVALRGWRSRVEDDPPRAHLTAAATHSLLLTKNKTHCCLTIDINVKKTHIGYIRCNIFTFIYMNIRHIDAWLPRYNVK